MSFCTVCGNALCGHTPEERGQTIAEMMRELNTQEIVSWHNDPDGSPERIKLAIQNAHLLISENPAPAETISFVS